MPQKEAADLILTTEVTPYDANISDDAIGETECNNSMSDEETGVTLSKLSGQQIAQP